jgi:hypothetical protein
MLVVLPINPEIADVRHERHEVTGKVVNIG